MIKRCVTEPQFANSCGVWRHLVTRRTTHLQFAIPLVILNNYVQRRPLYYSTLGTGKTEVLNECGVRRIGIGAVHKVRHAIFGQF